MVNAEDHVCVAVSSPPQVIDIRGTFARYAAVLQSIEGTHACILYVLCFHPCTMEYNREVVVISYLSLTYQSRIYFLFIRLLFFPCVL